MLQTISTKIRLCGGFSETSAKTKRKPSSCSSEPHSWVVSMLNTIWAQSISPESKFRQLSLLIKLNFHLAKRMITSVKPRKKVTHLQPTTSD